MISYKLRPYTQNDFGFVYQVKMGAFKGYVEKFWGVWDEKKQRSFFDSFIKKVQKSLLIVESQDVPIGIYNGEIIEKNTYEIGNIIIVPEYQRNGVGTDILLNVIKEHFGFKIRLQVFKGNPAINLYKKLNFVVVDETRTHYIMDHR